MSGRWCNSFGHHFVAPLWPPWGKWRCLHCGITEQQALSERGARIRERLATLELRQAESAERTADAIARADAVVARSREGTG